MGAAKLLALAALAALAAPAAAGTTTMCDNDGDFLPDPTVAATGGTCQQWKTDLLSSSHFNKAAWSDVTCDVARAAGYGAAFAPPYPQGHYIGLFYLLQVGKTCCGSLDKTICYDSTNMCKDDSDFNPEEAWGPSTCGDQMQHFFHYSSQNATSWDSMSCASLGDVKIGNRPESQTGTAILQMMGPICCGSLAKTRCVDNTNMCKEASDFKSSVDLGALGLGSPGSTCATTDVWFKNTLSASSWDDVTCDTVVSTSYSAGDATGTLGQALLDVGEACCGSLAKTRCVAPPGATVAVCPVRACSCQFCRQPRDVLTVLLTGSSWFFMVCGGTASAAPAPPRPQRGGHCQA